MPTPFPNPQALQDFITDKANAWASTRAEWARVLGEDRCYYLGIQGPAATVAGYVNTTSGRQYNGMGGESAHVKVIYNQLTRRIQKSSRATWPEKIETSVGPPIRDCGVIASVYTQVQEDLQTAWIKRSGFVEVARTANDMRAIGGTHGVLLTMRTSVRDVQMAAGQAVSMPDRRLGVEDFDPLALILDPAMPHRNLNMHEFVIYEKVMTETQLREMFPTLTINSNDLQKISAIAPYECQMNTASGGRLYQWFGQYSSTKGARVYQLYQKDDRGKWSIMYAMAAIKADWECPNFENPESPFGAQDFLPMELLHGHRRPQSPCSIGDVRMAKDPQDLLNLVMTQVIRILRNNAVMQWVIDKRWMGKNVEDEAVRNQLTNRVGGAIIGNPGSQDRLAQPPQLVTTPGIPPQFFELAGMFGSELQANTFRTDQDSGLVDKTHIPDKSRERAAIDSGQVLGSRVAEDCEAYARILTVASGTLIAGIQAGSPTMLQMVREEGFDDQDLAVVLQSDPMYPTCGTVVQESSIRYRSPEEKRGTILELATTQTADGKPLMSREELRRGLAQLDMSASDDDQYMGQQINKMVARCVQGEEWQPIRLGDYNKWCLTALQREVVSKECQRDPATRDRISRAYDTQFQIAVQDAMASDPEVVAAQQLQAQAEAAAMQQAQMQAQTQAAATEQEAAPKPQNIGEIVDELANPRQAQPQAA